MRVVYITIFTIAEHIFHLFTKVGESAQYSIDNVIIFLVAYILHKYRVELLVFIGDKNKLNICITAHFQLII